MDINNLDGYYISGTDPHFSEYLCDHWQLRRYFTGFTGSYGEVVITREKAGLWTDSRYFIQAEQELAGSGVDLFRLRIPGAVSAIQWLTELLPGGSRIGVDPASTPLALFRQLSQKRGSGKFHVVLLPEMVDEIWKERPSLPSSPIVEMGIQVAGVSRQEKLGRIQNIAKTRGASLTIISALDDLAWSFNLRGGDIPYNPLFYGFALVGEPNHCLFVQKDTLGKGLIQKLNDEGIRVLCYSEFYKVLSELKRRKIYFDPSITNIAIQSAIYRKHSFVEGPSIPSGLKSVKNSAEIAGFRECMRKDGVALVKFHWWLAKNEFTRITEYDVSRKLTELRMLQPGFKGDSFPPIVGYREHGAIVHLSVNQSNALPLAKEGVLLFDSGGHYFNGTTDVTRTVALGPVSERQKRDFTLVLKGMINLSRAIFPYGTRGIQLDILARQSLWKESLNYGHGTGHGVGHFLTVHEGPASIRQEYNPTLIEAGMIFSNEPGIYRAGEYGIRIENMMLCVEKADTESGKFLGFETLTLCPLDLNLVIPELLTPGEKKWLNQYHRKVRNELAPFLTGPLARFLEEITPDI